MSLSTRSLSLAGAALLLGASATAQGFNVDFNSPFCTLCATPASTYAGAGTAGVWNPVDASLTGPHALVDKTGAATGVTLTQSGSLLNTLEFDNLNFTGDDAALMEDIVYGGGGAGASHTITISGLAAGNYDVITYAQAPDDKLNFLTDVSVAGSLDGIQTVGGLTWPGTHVLGGSHARHAVSVAAGADLVVTITVNASFDSVNGLQIEPSAPTGTAYCFGDGTGATCPCAGFGSAGEGCLNTSGTGATLAGTGAANVGADSLVLSVTGGPANKPGIFFQGNNQLAGNPAGDGILCTAGGTIRYSVNPLDANGGTSQGGFGVNATSGSTKNYQYWYRDTGNACGGGFNFTNGWSQPWN
jgi:hypothetical protein